METWSDICPFKKGKLFAALLCILHDEVSSHTYSKMGNSQAKMNGSVEFHFKCYLK